MTRDEVPKMSIVQGRWILREPKDGKGCTTRDCANHPKEISPAVLQRRMGKVSTTYAFRGRCDTP